MYVVPDTMCLHAGRRWDKACSYVRSMRLPLIAPIWANLLLCDSFAANMLDFMY